MTGSEDSGSTRPISVAELLAKNGTIGAPPVGGRRRRRRGNADAVTVAELTGEIPVVRPTDPYPSAATPAVDEPEVVAEPSDESAEEVVSTNGAVDHADIEPEVAEEAEAVSEDVVVDEAAADVAEEEAAEEEAAEEDDEQADDDYADAVAEYSAHLEQRDAEPAPVDFAPPPRRFGFGRRSSTAPAAGDAEQMLPDPVDDGDETAVLESPVDVDEGPEIEDLDDEAALEADDSDELPSYLRSTQEPLFGGQTVADDLARRGSRPAPDDVDLGELEAEDERDDEVAELGEPRRMSSFVHGLWIVGQSVLAVAFGAGLFVAFDQLWKWNNIIALVLSVLVILGLVVGVRVVRKTEDIGSTLIAVAVGALVTLGPLALLQSG
ncbi:hypothetical protein [Mycolicibacterium pyrenivorans]|uniref:hypothetical protein n=1 Tax=Mycolicibacterium pyrenivorans TaxID=187102 RepID=UPI0021F37614|nr:hypothetical protein [Mycolicibacterium pyrenivorans]MCV7151453.1 hypothetical protein [Mycolicibacterium pyrenivorans]